MTAIADVPRRLSLLEDEDELVATMQRRMAKKGFELTRVIPATPSLEDMVEQIMSVSDGALCDHHLRGGHKVTFSGAEVVAALTERHFPAVLFTGLLSQERYAIRRNMGRIPAFLNREDGLGPKRLIDALAVSVLEASGQQRVGARRGRRTPVTITDVRLAASEHLVSALVSGWPGRDPIEIPADLLGEPWASAPRDAIGKTFMATVNIAEPNPDLVFFEDFETEPLDADEYEGIRVVE